MPGESDTDVLRLTAKIISAHVGNNQVTVAALPELIQSVHRSLATAGTAEPAPAPAPLTPAVPIRKSVFPDHIVCLEDGKKLKLLKRHLRVSYGMCFLGLTRVTGRGGGGSGSQPAMVRAHIRA